MLLAHKYYSFPSSSVPFHGTIWRTKYCFTQVRSKSLPGTGDTAPHRLLTPDAKVIIILLSTALYCNPIFFTYKLLLLEGRSAPNRLWKIPDISSFMCTRSCSQPLPCLPVSSCAQVTQQKYLKQGTNTLTRRHWGFGGWIFIFLTSPPTSAYCLLSIFSLFLFFCTVPSCREQRHLHVTLQSTVLFDLTIILIPY